MASGQGGVGAVSALQSHHYPGGPHWSPGAGQYQQQQQHHTARSLERALEDAACSGLLNLSGRKLREYPGMSYDLTDTTQAGGRARARGGTGAAVNALCVEFFFFFFFLICPCVCVFLFIFFFFFLTARSG